MAYAEVATKKSTISTAIEDLDPIIDRARTYAERLGKIHDQIHGPRPAEIMGEKASDRPQSIISAISFRRSQLVEVLDHIERSINGIEGGL